MRSGRVKDDYFSPLVDLLNELCGQKIIALEIYERLLHYVKDIEVFLKQEINPNKKKKIALERAFFLNFKL